MAIAYCILFLIFCVLWVWAKHYDLAAWFGFVAVAEFCYWLYGG